MFSQLLFDLDNTLYPASAEMNEKVTFRTISCVAEYLGISYEQARTIRAQNVPRFGTTLEWLRAEQGLPDSAVEDYLATVHPENEINEVCFDPALRNFLISLNMPMAVLTNSPREHARRVLQFLKIDDLFVHVFDIRAAGFLGKPHKKTYEKALLNSGFTLERTLFFDDAPKYAQGYADLGGTAVLVDEQNKHPETPLRRIKSIYEIPHLLEQLHSE